MWTREKIKNVVFDIVFNDSQYRYFLFNTLIYRTRHIYRTDLQINKTTVDGYIIGYQIRID